MATENQKQSTLGPSKRQPSRPTASVLEYRRPLFSVGRGRVANSNAGNATTGKTAAAGASAAGGNSSALAPGFQNPNGGGAGPSPRSMDPDRRQHDHMLAAAGGGQGAGQQPQGKMAKLAGALSNFSREMQYAANRQNTNMGHDGNTGSAPSMRLNI